MAWSAEGFAGGFYSAGVVKNETGGEAMKALLARLLAARKNRLPPGRCSCGEPTVKWCTRHGRPLNRAPQGEPAWRRLVAQAWRSPKTVLP